MRNLTDQEIQTYRQDGVVCLRGVLSDLLVNRIDEAINSRIRDRSFWAKLLSKPSEGFYTDVYMWPYDQNLYDVYFNLIRDQIT